MNGTRTSLEKAYLLFICKAVVLSPLLALQFKLSSLFFIMPSMLQLCFLSPPLGSVPPKIYVGSQQQSAAGVREACFEDSVLEHSLFAAGIKQKHYFTLWRNREVGNHLSVQLWNLITICVNSDALDRFWQTLDCKQCWWSTCFCKCVYVCIEQIKIYAYL